MNGYSELASIMGHYPEMGMVRRFTTLNTLNLLYHQAELVVLEEELRHLAKDDIGSGDERRTYFAQDWTFLSKAKGNGDEKQWQKMLQIRQKLQVFSEYKHS